MRSAEVHERIGRDMEGGLRSGVQGTPTFFINEVKYEGSWDYDSLLSAIKATGSESRD